MTNLLRWETIRKLRELMAPTPPEAGQQWLRIKSIERDIMIPVKLIFILGLGYYLYFSQWLTTISTTREVAIEATRRFYFFYVGINLVVAGMLMVMRRFRLKTLQWILLGNGLIDGLLVAGLTLITGGFDSILFWIFPALIVRNALMIPLARPQLTLNFTVSFCYLLSGVLDVAVKNREASTFATFDESTRRAMEALELAPPDSPAEPFILRLVILFFVTVCCYGLQVLFEKNRQAAEEGREYAVRQQQLGAASRIAAEIAHQIKNPLSIINNAAFNLQRALSGEREDIRIQIGIIREEVERSDRIVTELMGYSQLAEGRLEKLDVLEELERAIAQVYPSGAYAVEIKRDFESDLPWLLMQRGHLSAIFVNILLNAREAMEGRGKMSITVRNEPDYAISVVFGDTGPGIAPHHVERIFEAHYTTKPRGTGLGLSIVRHNLDLYGGKIHTESVLGRGTRFVLLFPAKTMLKVNS